jgi:hypothetical protein
MYVCNPEAALDMLVNCPSADTIVNVNPLPGDTPAHIVYATLPINFANFVKDISAATLWMGLNKAVDTPVMVAAQQELFSQCHMHALMSHAEVPCNSWTSVDRNGWTVLHHALKHGHLWLLDYAELAAFRNLDPPRTEAMQPLLHLVALGSHANLIPRLLEAGHAEPKTTQRR